MKKSDLVFLLLGVYTSACGQRTFDQQMESMYKHTVPLIRAAELDSLQQQQPVVLLDTRTPEEYAVSHLRDARFVNYKTFTLTEVEGLSKDTNIVVYCAVGYRSERVGEQLQEAGYRRVHNLYGGIFDWKNQGYSVINPQGQPTDSIHTYNRRWSKWLEKGVKVW